MYSCYSRLLQDAPQKVLSTQDDRRFHLFGDVSINPSAVLATHAPHGRRQASGT